MAAPPAAIHCMADPVAAAAALSVMVCDAAAPLATLEVAACAEEELAGAEVDAGVPVEDGMAVEAFALDVAVAAVLDGASFVVAGLVAAAFSPVSVAVMVTGRKGMWSVVTAALVICVVVASDMVTLQLTTDLFRNLQSWVA